MENHKRVLGILLLVMSAFLIMVMAFLNIFLSTIFTFAQSQAETKDAEAIEFVRGLVSYIPLFVIIVFAVPSVIAGIGLLTKKSWAMILALIIGCVHLLSFPIGTALGVYTIWIYSEEQRLNKATPPAP
jgi:hypothetical protein